MKPRSSSTRALQDIAGMLSSANGSDARILGVLEVLRRLVPYEQCAVLDAQPGLPQHFISAPAGASVEQAVTTIFDRLMEERSRAPGATEPAERSSGAHLTVSLMSLDDVTGILFVRTAEGTYRARHLRVLSVVGAQL